MLAQNLTKVNLTEEHLKNLRESGLSDETIIRAGFTTVTLPSGIGAVSAYKIPYPGTEGFYRLRLFGTTNSGFKYYQPPGTPCRLYVPHLINRTILNDPSIPIVVCEGEKKGLRAAETGLPCIAIGGVWNWKKKDEDTLIPDFDLIALNKRKVIVAFDNDIFEKIKIQQACRKFKKALEARGAIVEVRPIPFGPYKGLDDWLCHNPADSVWTLPIYELPPETFALTDFGNAERFIEQHGEDVRFWHERGVWLIWDGIRWAEDPARKVITKKAIKTVRSIYKEALEADNEDTRKRIAAHAVKSESRERIDAMLGLAQRLISITADELDRNPWIFNTASGPIDLKTGKLLKPDRALYITKQSPAVYNIKANAPRFQSFLNEIFLNNTQLVHYVQKIIGYSLTGLTTEKVFHFFHGGGDNGKTVLIEVMLYLFGDYGLCTPVETLMAKSHDGGIPNDIARLRGARFVSCSETEEGQRFAESKIKMLTGGDTISARFLHREFFDFCPTHKLFVYGQHKPVIRGVDEAIWNRVRLVPFNASFPPGNPKRDDKLKDKLIENELSGILNWAIEGCLLWQKEGLGLPEKIQDAARDYRKEMDLIGNFIEERCIEVNITDEEDEKEKIYADYKEWCSRNGNIDLSANKFTRQMEDKGYKIRKSNGRRYYSGLKLNPYRLEIF